MQELDFILYDKEESIGMITLNRPETRNAQHPPLLRELDTAFSMAEKDKDIKVIILKANGPSFSAGHDIGTAESRAYWEKNPRDPGAESRWEYESDAYLGYSRRWRDIPKPTIAAVQGYCIAGGLMLAWPCDIIIASDDAKFSDPVLRMGIPGVEYFAHPWEWGHRKAKELLFTGEFIDAQEAHRLGMVNKVVAKDDLLDETMTMAQKISQMDAWSLRMAKKAVNDSMDAMGQHTAMQGAFALHQLSHTHSELVHGDAISGMDVQKMRAKSGAS